MKRAGSFFCLIIILATFWSCQRYVEPLEEAGERITRPAPMKFPEYADQILQESTDIIEGFSSVAGEKILATLFEESAGVAIFPGLAEPAFAASGNRGTGVFLARGNTGWTLPVFATLGSRLGEQIGATRTDFLLFLRSPEAVSRLREETAIDLGAGLTAAVGPIGASADLSFIKDADLVAYKFTEGKFIGFHIPGGVLSLSPEMTISYYMNPEQGTVRGYYAKEAERLLDHLLSLDERSVSRETSTGNARKLKITLDRLTGAPGS